MVRGIESRHVLGNFDDEMSVSIEMIVWWRSANASNTDQDPWRIMAFQRTLSYHPVQDDSFHTAKPSREVVSIKLVSIKLVSIYQDCP